MRLVLVVLPAARYVPRQQGASAVLLAVDQFLFADVEDKGIECFELGLLSKGSHVACHESWVFQTFANALGRCSEPAIGEGCGGYTRCGAFGFWFAR